MNAKTLLTALSLVIAGSAAMAAEGEQFNPAPSTLTRAEVKADINVSKPNVVVSYGEATVFADAPVATTHRSREEVRAEARAAAHNLKFNELYAG